MVKNEIKVFARLKPEGKKKNVVNYQIHRRPKKHLEEDYLVLNGAQKSINEYINNRPESWNFAFYKIFDDDIRQDEVFENVVQPVIQSVLNGYNATIFAYGQTGSGKTYTITGDPERYEDRGVLPRTVQYLFETIQKNPDNLYSVEIAYLEIYNENGYDLLDPKHEVVTKLEDLPRVTIQEDETGTLRLKNLSFRNVDNEKEALALLFLGDTNRAISDTPMNPQSSRSHCIFTIAVSVKQSGAQHLTKAKMHLVDLAGSERVYKCCISGTILTEAKHINLSLHYLEQVIVCLGQQNVSHIPYRNSLLTAILRDSLGGNCLTTMLATLSLNTSNFEETISTCRFSQRVALTKNDVKLVLEKNPEDENRFLKIEVERLRNQIAQLTERPIISGELTTNEKQDLDLMISKFLETDAKIDWKNDERKIKYCLQVLRENYFKSRNGKNLCVKESEKDLNYYRNLVVQRDKEISALINMLKKSRRNSSDNLADDPGPFNARENHGETSPRISVITKKVRLRDLMVEAKSIAELIKNGKASIGDLRTRITNVINPVEIQALQKNLQIEQSRLAHNLSSLKSLKSEAKDVKTALMENENSKNVVANSTHHNINQKSSAPRIETDLKNSSIDDDDDRQRYLTSSQTLTSPKSRKQDEDQMRKTIRPTEQSKILSITLKEMESPSKRTDQDVDYCEVICTSSVRESGDSNEVSGETAKNVTDIDAERNGLRSPESKIATFVNANLKKCGNDSDSRLSLVGERFFDTKTLPNGESRRSSFRAPVFLQNMLRSGADSDVGFKSLKLDRDVDLSHCDIETNTLREMGQSFRADLSRSNASNSQADVPKSMINSSKSEVSNVSKVQEFFNGNDSDCKTYKPDGSSPDYKLSCDRYDQFYKASNSSEKYVKEDSEKSDIQVQQPIFIPDENRESNTIEEDSIMREDDSFMKSLPLTGDPEIDEEIIAFYRAKRSGGTY